MQPFYARDNDNAGIRLRRFPQRIFTVDRSGSLTLAGPYGALLPR